MPEHVYLRPPLELTRPQASGVVPAADAMPGGCQYSLKLDGFRAAAFALPDGPVLQARSGTDLLPRFPQLREPLAALPLGTVLDGEVVAFAGGRFDFPSLLTTATARRQAGVEVRYVAFDLLAVPDRSGSRDMRGLPLSARWAYLKGLLAAVPPPIERIMATTDRDTAMVWFDALAAVGVEGLVIKPLDGAYGARWVKVRHSETLDAVALAVLGPAGHPRALRVRLPDGREAVTSPHLNPVQARMVAQAGVPPFPVEVRVTGGRHQVVRFVRVRRDG